MSSVSTHIFALSKKSWLFFQFPLKVIFRWSCSLNSIVCIITCTLFVITTCTGLTFYTAFHVMMNQWLSLISFPREVARTPIAIMFNLLSRLFHIVSAIIASSRAVIWYNELGWHVSWLSRANSSVLSPGAPEPLNPWNLALPCIGAFR